MIFSNYNRLTKFVYSLSVTSAEIMTSSLPGVAGFSYIFVLMERIDGSSILGADSKNFSLMLSNQTRLDNASCCVHGAVCGGRLPFRSYYTFLEEGLESQAVEFLSASNATMYIAVAIHECNSVPKKTRESNYRYAMFLQTLSQNLSVIAFPSGSVSVRVTSDVQLGRAVQDGIESDMALCDSIAFPLALLIFAVLLFLLLVKFLMFGR